MKITNNTNLGLILAVWLLHDNYDHVKMDNYYSATTLMKPTKQVILGSRVPDDQKEMDIADLTASAYGSAIHDSIEKAWITDKEGALKALGYPKSVIDRVLVNPEPADLVSVTDPIPVYFERRAIKEIEVDGVTYHIGGKFDVVADGVVQDNKSTSVYTYTLNRKDDDYRLQLSIYRWLNPDIVTEDYGYINFVFTDWQKMMAKRDPNYPQRRLVSKAIDLMSLAETEAWIIERVRLLANNKDMPEAVIPPCTDKELWRSDPVHKYYADATKVDGRATKNFDNLADARAFMAEKGKGTVITVPGQVKACGYCPGFAVCEQKDQYEL